MKTNVQSPARPDWTDPVTVQAIQILYDALIAEARARRAAKGEATDERQR